MTRDKLLIKTSCEFPLIKTHRRIKIDRRNYPCDENLAKIVRFGDLYRFCNKNATFADFFADFRNKSRSIHVDKNFSYGHSEKVQKISLTIYLQLLWDTLYVLTLGLSTYFHLIRLYVSYMFDFTSVYTYASMYTAIA